MGCRAFRGFQGLFRVLCRGLAREWVGLGWVGLGWAGLGWVPPRLRPPVPPRPVRSYHIVSYRIVSQSRNAIFFTRGANRRRTAALALNPKP